jgi:hypothetical protein
MRLRYSKSIPRRASARYLRFGLDRSAGQRRSALIERLLARADAAGSAGEWRSDAFELIAGPGVSVPAVAPCAWWAEQARAASASVAAGGVATGASRLPAGVEARSATVFIATPVEYVAEISNVRLANPGILALPPADAAVLAADFGRVFGEAGARLIAAPSGRLFCLHDREVVSATWDPESAAGRHIQEFLPTGRDGAPLRRLMSEMEMWLFEHEVNRRRASAALPAVGGLWLWGGGPVLESLPPTRGGAAGTDPMFDAFRAPGEAAAATIMAVSAPPGGDGWGELESRWLVPAVADLCAGRIEEIRLSAGERAFRLSARASRRFWRRTRPWWEHFGAHL